MGSDNEELFHEDILYGEDHDGNSHDAVDSDEGEQDTTSDNQTSPVVAKQKSGVDIVGGSSASQQSSTLHGSLEEDLGHSVPQASPSVDIPSSMLSHGRPPAGSVHTTVLPKGPQYPRLGTSAPIAIPNMHRWRPDSKEGSGQQPAAASTFIPPHQLSKQDDFMFSFTGASPSATLKRERLRTRNAILRSTGFLEPQAGRVMPAVELTAGMAAARTPVQSSLTAALSTIGEA